MTPKQMIEFDARREAVLRAHLKANPRYRKMRSNRRVAIAAGVVRYSVAVVLALFLIKSFIISQNGPAGYLSMMAPVFSQLNDGGMLARVVAPDPYSTMMATMIADLTRPTPGVVDSSLDGFERVGPDLSGS